MATNPTGSKLSPAQLAANFAQMTRQNWHQLPAISGAADAEVEFKLPKVRLGSKVRVEVSATLTATHASNTTYVPDAFAPFNLIKKVTVDMNNGFSPFTITGKELYMYSLINHNGETIIPATSGRGKVVQPLVASSGGTANAVRFVVDLPLTLNDRDPVGLILLQNEETNVTINLTLGNANSLAPAASGYTFAVSNIVLAPMAETFSIPIVGDAIPDISVLKLVQSKKETINGAGEFTLKLPVGTTYRKLLFFVENASGVGVADSSLTGNIDVVFNQADTPYRIKPSILAAINHEQFGTPLPTGLYAWDFSYQGFPSYGGARDYIDTEKLTEFWVKFNPSVAGQVTAVYETLSRLRS